MTKKIRAAGFKGVIDWSSTVTVYKKGLGNSGPTALLAHGSSVTDDQTQKSYTLLQYAYREWAREIGGDDPDDYYAKADDISDVPIVDVLNTTNLQVEYINEVKAFYSKPEVENLMAKMKHIQLEKAVTDYVRHHSTVNNDVLKKIKNGDVELVELNGKRLNNLVSIDLANGNKLFVSLMDSKVYEATVTDSGRSLKFATKEIADRFSLTLKGSSTLRALKDADSNFGRTMDDGTLQLVDPNKENKFLGNYTPVIARGVLAHDGTGSIFKTISTGNNYNRNYSVELTKEHVNTLVSDADYMMKSTREISLDYWMNTVGKWGTRAGVLCLPVFGVLGVAASPGSALAFLGSASASWALTMVTGVGTETVMAFAADREADASAHLKNAWIAMLSEQVGQGLGEFVIPKVMQLTPRFSEIVENALKRTSRSFKNVDDIADFIKKLDSDNSSSGYDSVNLDSKSSSSFNTKPKSLSSNSSSSGYDSPHYSRSVKTKRKFNEDALKNATKNMEDLTDSYKKFMSVGSEPKYKLHNELQYRALWLKLEQEGYNVKTGFVTILNDSGYKSRALILKASKHGDEDAFMYIKPPHIGQASIHGTEFDNNLKIFNEEDFSKHYLSDFEHNSNLVTVDWYDGYFNVQQRGFYGENHVFGSDAQVLNRPKWFDSQKAEAAVDLLAMRRRGGATPEELQIATSRFAKYVKDVPDYALAIGALPAGYTAVDLVPKLVNSLESASFEEVTAPDGQKAADAPSNIAYVGTDLTLIKPSRSSGKSGISVLSLNNEPITVHRNNDIKGAVQQATQTHEKLNFAEETKPSKKNFALQSQVLAVKNKFGSNINPDAIKTPIVIAIDTSKIPGYKAGQPLPVFIPFEAIIEIKTDKGYADTTNYFADTFLSRDVSVSEIKVNPIERFEHTIAADKTTIQYIALFYSTKFNETYENILAHILRDNREAINSSNRAVVNGKDSLSIGTKLKIRKYPPKEPWAGTPDERTAWERQKIMQRANM